MLFLDGGGASCRLAVLPLKTLLAGAVPLSTLLSEPASCLAGSKALSGPPPVVPPAGPLVRRVSSGLQTAQPNGRQAQNHWICHHAGQ